MDYSKERSKWWFGVCYHKEQLDDIINCVDIRGYAYIMHDKDTLPETGELKKPHYHFLVHLSTMQRGSWFKRFWSDDMGRIFPEPTRAPKSCFEYLTHKDPKSVKAGKFLYNDDEVISTLEELENEELKAEDNAGTVFEDLGLIVNGQLSWHAFFKKYPKRIHSTTNYCKAFNLLYEEAYGFDLSNKNTERTPSSPPPKSNKSCADKSIKIYDCIDQKKTVEQILAVPVNGDLPF